MCAHSWKSSKINVMKYMSLFTHIIIITGNQRQFADLPIVHLIYNAVCYHDSQFMGLKAQNETKAETKALETRHAALSADSNQHSLSSTRHTQQNIAARLQVINALSIPWQTSTQAGVNMK